MSDGGHESSKIDKSLAYGAFYRTDSIWGSPPRHEISFFFKHGSTVLVGGT